MKEMSQRRRLEPGRMKTPSLRVTTLHNHADPISYTRVAWRAVDVVSLLSTLKHLHRSREGHAVALFSVHQPRVEVRICMQLIPRNRILDLRTHRAAIRIEVCPTLRKELGLIMHILTAARHNQQRQRRSGEGDAPGGQFHLCINDPPPPRRPQGTARGTSASQSAKTLDRQPPNTERTYRSSHHF